MKTNYHTHNYRCKHAVGTVEDYIKVAIDEGYDEIGISDHMSHPGMNVDNKARMYYYELNSYFNDIDKTIKKYGDKISIKKGLECEYFDHIPYFYEELKHKFNVDYLILGAHFFKYADEWLYVGWHLDKDMLKEYTNSIIKAMETGLFKYLAHPDLFFIVYKEWDKYSIEASKRILEAAERLKMPIEINVNGFTKAKIKTSKGERYPYPVKEFWELSKNYKVDRIIGIDAHKPENLKSMNKGIEFAQKLNLEVIDRLEF